MIHQPKSELVLIEIDNPTTLLLDDTVKSITIHRNNRYNHYDNPPELHCEIFLTQDQINHIARWSDIGNLDEY